MSAHAYRSAEHPDIREPCLSDIEAISAQNGGYLRTSRRSA
jgi:hypothetical protein